MVIEIMIAVYFHSIGDRSARFFHPSTIKRRKVNKIENLKLSDSTWSTDPDAV